VSGCSPAATDEVVFAERNKPKEGVRRVHVTAVMPDNYLSHVKTCMLLGLA
jgi:hypothetical protein